MKTKSFETVAIHFTSDCKLYCPFCYKKSTGVSLPFRFFLKLPKYIKRISPQISLGGGEPFLYPEFIEKMGKKCKRAGVALNITTNGKRILNMDINVLKKALQNVTMVSVSYDDFKYTDLHEYRNVIARLKVNSSAQIGANVLMLEEMVKENSAKDILSLIELLFKFGVDRVFCLCPKIVPAPNILRLKPLYELLGREYPYFYVDDLTHKILSEGYTDWKTPCHYGKMISINERGWVSGCSFDENNKVLELRKPSDLLKITEIDFKEKYECPYLNKTIREV